MLFGLAIALGEGSIGLAWGGLGAGGEEETGGSGRGESGRGERPAGDGQSVDSSRKSPPGTGEGGVRMSLQRW